MSRRPRLFRQTDVTRAIKAAQKAGLTVSSIQIDAGGQITLVSNVANVLTSPTGQSAYEKWRASHGKTE